MYLSGYTYEKQESANMPVNPPNMPIKEIMYDVYVDYLNNFATVVGYAKHYNLDWHAAEKLLDAARKIYSDVHHK